MRLSINFRFFKYAFFIMAFLFSSLHMINFFYCKIYENYRPEYKDGIDIVVDIRKLSEEKKALIYNLSEVIKNENITNPLAWASAIVKYSPTIDIGYIALITALVRRETHFMERQYIETIVDYLIPDIIYDPIMTIGPISLHKNIARQIIKIERGALLNDHQVKKEMNTIEGGIKYSIAYLDWIISLYKPDRKLTANSEEKNDEDSSKAKNESDYLVDSSSTYIIADYVSGIYSAKKAAFIKILNDLNGSSLPVDGDIGNLTIKEIEFFIKQRIRKDGQREQLLDSIENFAKTSRNWTKKIAMIEQNSIFKIARQEWQNTFHKTPPDRICPEITYWNFSTILKGHGIISVREYVTATNKFYKKYYDQLSNNQRITQFLALRKPVGQILPVTLSRF